MLKLNFTTLLIGFLPVVFATFGVTTSGSKLIIDSGAGLVTQINTANGDITSLVFRGKQLQDHRKFTHLNSGLGSEAKVDHTEKKDVVIVTIKTSLITHYYIFRSGINTLYCGTFTSKEPSRGELRFIARLDRSALPHGIPAADVQGGTTIEGKDVAIAGGETRSKFYSSVRFIEDKVHGVTGPGVGAFMIIPGVSYETSSGGPFFRDINNQGSSQQELYWYMNSGHEQSEGHRTGFYGPYALAITTGPVPSASLDTNFMDSLGLQDYVGVSGRGTVSGTYSGTLTGPPVTIGFQNSKAQYWISGDHGRFSRDLMKPGIYNVTLYQGELEAGTDSVTVNAGKTSSLTMKSKLHRPFVLWSIGTVDGTPAGFLNADKIERMHPSDLRMNSWGPVTFTVGKSQNATFPMAQFKGVNDPTTIEWTATSSECGERTLRIRTTEAFAGGRPMIIVNSWSPSKPPPPPPKVDSRGVTRGTWRGINQVYDYVIPAGKLVPGRNTIAIHVLSGNKNTDSNKFLSPNFVYDSVELF